jgi:hypothetical protein
VMSRLQCSSTAGMRAAIADGVPNTGRTPPPLHQSRAALRRRRSCFAAGRQLAIIRISFSESNAPTQNAPQCSCCRPCCRCALYTPSNQRRSVPERARHGTRLVFRQGSPLVPADLRLVAASRAGATVIISDQSRWVMRPQSNRRAHGPWASDVTLPPPLPAALNAHHRLIILGFAWWLSMVEGCGQTVHFSRWGQLERVP